MHAQSRKKEKEDCSPTSLVGLGETLNQRRARAASLLSLNFLIVGVRIVQGGGVGGVGGEGRESRQSETWGDKTRKVLWGGENPKGWSGPTREEKGKRKR